MRLWRRGGRLTGSAVLVVLVAACGADAGNSGGAAGDDENVHQEGPVSFVVPEGWDRIEPQGEVQEDSWTAGWDDDEDDPWAYIRVMPNMDTPPRADTAASFTLVPQCSFTNIYADDCSVEGREDAEIDGASDAQKIDFQYDGGDFIGRWWVMADEDSDTAAAVEYVALDATEEELEDFADMIEFSP